LSAKDARAVQLAQRTINFNNNYPKEFTEKFSQAKSQSLEAWKIAKENNDRNYFVPYLQTSLQYAKEYASIYNSQMHPYDVWLDG
jgi:Zn-dependent M32 family carboxypeptidase